MAGGATIPSPLLSTARMDETGAIGAARCVYIRVVSIAISNATKRFDVERNDGGGELITGRNVRKKG